MVTDWREEWLPALVLTGATLLIYLFVRQIGKSLKPPFAALEFASNQGHAKRALLSWEDTKTKGQASWRIGFESFLLIPMYVMTAWALAEAASDSTRSGADFLVVGAVGLAALLHYAENFCLIFTLISGARGLVVLATRLLAWSKTTILALTVVYTIIRAEMFLDERIGQQTWPYTLTALIIATLVMAFVVARRLTALSASYPPLLALQLAPSRLAAKDVMERWGDKGRKAAQRTLLLQSVFAVLYGLTLAGLCKRVDVKVPVLQGVAEYLAGLMLIAAACHVAQNLGAYVALRLRGMGWWVTVMRRLGWMRMILLTLAAGYFVVLLVRREWHVVTWVGVRIARMAPEMRLPWT